MTEKKEKAVMTLKLFEDNTCDISSSGDIITLSGLLKVATLVNDEAIKKSFTKNQ